MAVNPSIVGNENIAQASAGNPALQAVLQQLTNAANAQATQTNTSGKNSPNQSNATISFQNPLYIVTITDPGGATALSLAQQAQIAASQSLGSNPTQSNIFHQVQAATSVLFDAPSGLMTYGGDTGNLQTQFIIGGLDPTKAWYFRLRTSYDGNIWNTWKLINPLATTVNPNATTLEPVAGGQWAGITLLGGQQVGFGIGQLANGLEIQTADGVLMANTIGVAAPAGYGDTGFEVYGIAECDINALGVVTLTYTDNGAHLWTGNANYLTFGWAVGAQNISEQKTADGGEWVVLTLPGGSRIAIGSGKLPYGATFDVPLGFTAANSMGVCTPEVADLSSHPAYGVYQATVVAGVCSLQFADSTGHIWNSSANWFALAWEPSLSMGLVTVTGGTYLKIPTLSGPIMIGVGQGHSGTIMPLPAGYTYPKCLAFSTPAAFDNYLQYAMHGVDTCQIDAGLTTSVGTITCLYGTVTGKRTGAAAWFAVAWL